MPSNPPVYHRQESLENISSRLQIFGIAWPVPSQETWDKLTPVECAMLEQQGIPVSRILFTRDWYSNLQIPEKIIDRQRKNLPLYPIAHFTKDQIDDLARAILENCDLRYCCFSKLQLCGFHMRMAILEGAVFRSAQASGINLSYAKLRSADLKKADLHYANLRGADLRGADLTKADLREADLSGADLSNAILKKTNLTGSCLSGAKLKGAIIRGIRLEGNELDDAEMCATVRESIKKNQRTKRWIGSWIGSVVVILALLGLLAGAIWLTVLFWKLLLPAGLIALLIYSIGNTNWSTYGSSEHHRRQAEQFNQYMMNKLRR